MITYSTQIYNPKSFILRYVLPVVALLVAFEIFLRGILDAGIYLDAIHLGNTIKEGNHAS
jgi:hypothetical protein